MVGNRVDILVPHIMEYDWIPLFECWGAGITALWRVGSAPLFLAWLADAGAIMMLGAGRRELEGKNHSVGSLPRSMCTRVAGGGRKAACNA